MCLVSNSKMAIRGAGYVPRAFSTREHCYSVFFCNVTLLFKWFVLEGTYLTWVLRKTSFEKSPFYRQGYKTHTCHLDYYYVDGEAKLQLFSRSIEEITRAGKFEECT